MSSAVIASTMESEFFLTAIELSILARRPVTTTVFRLAAS